MALPSDLTEKKKGLESYIARKTENVRVPVDPGASLYQDFGVKRLKLRRDETRGARITPVRGGFVVEHAPTESTRSRRFLIAHELAHTYFYELRGEGRVPRSKPHPREEELANYGARAILMPLGILRERLQGEIDLDGILDTAQELDVFPHWLAFRTMRDLDWQTGVFAHFIGDDRGLDYVPNDEVVALRVLSKRRLRKWLRAEVAKARAEKQTSVAPITQLPGVVNCQPLVLEIRETQKNLFCRDVYALLAHRAIAASTQSRGSAQSQRRTA